MTTAPGRPRLPRAATLVMTLGLLAVACASEDRTAIQIAGGDPERGRQVMRQYGCSSCHTIPGVPGATALVGPPLTKLARRAVIAGHLPNTPDNLMRWVRHPQATRHPTAMPEMGVSEEDSRHIAAYLYTLR